MRLFFCFLCLTSLLSSQGDFKINLEEEGNFWVRAKKDSTGLLAGYLTDLKVPVCEDKVCYDVEIAFHWNLIGEFDHFKVSEKAPLTKLDHVPFSKEDYQKLERILKSKDLSFVKLNPKELVEPNTDPKVDAYSGATKTTIKNEVIEGALFTCHTLWHIANGTVVDSIKTQTKNALNRGLIEKMISKNQASFSYYLLDQLSEQELFKNLDLFLRYIPKSEGYFGKNAIEKFPPYFFETPEINDFIKSNFLNIDHYTQKALISKLLLCNNVASLNSFFLSQIKPSNSFNYQLMIQLILKNPTKGDLQNLIEELRNQKIKLSKENYENLLKSAHNAQLSIRNIHKL